MGVATAIHTTADFEMEKLFHTDEKAVETLYQGIIGKRIRTIVTDVTMAASGIRKGALERLGVKVKCYLGDPRTAAMATEKGITRTQAGTRLAVEDHPDALFVFGNAPTALMELCDLIRKGKAHPVGLSPLRCASYTYGVQAYDKAFHRHPENNCRRTQRRKQPCCNISKRRFVLQ